MTINNSVLESIRSDIAGISSMIKSNKSDMRGAMIALRDLHAERGKQPADPRALERRIEAQALIIANRTHSNKNLKRHITMLHTALAFARGKQHLSPRREEASILEHRARVHFAEVYGWYEFWNSDNDS